MEPTLQEGDYVYTTMLPYLFGTPEIGDIVIVDISLTAPAGYFHMFSQVLKQNTIFNRLANQAQAELDTCWIKRVVGVAGDELSFRDGNFYRNGQLVQEEYLKDQNVWTYSTDTVIVVPDGYLYVMGDNRNASKDSRDANVGPVPCYQIIGKMWKAS